MIFSVIIPLSTQGDLIMFEKKMKTVLCLICSILLLITFFACGNTSDSSTEPTSESTSVPYDEDKINAVIENEPDGYTIPKIDFVKKKFLQPTLTDEEMYVVVFENHSEIAQTDSDGNYPMLDHELGEAYFSFTAGTEFDVVYKCFGISTDIELSDEFSTYKIITDFVSPSSRSAAPINNAYWHKYFKIMLTNLEFQVSTLTENMYTVFAYVYDNESENKITHMVCSDGFVRTKQSDGTILTSDKKVDAPEIYMVATLFERIHKTDYLNSVASITLPNEEITFHYNGKTAKIKSVDTVKVGYNERKYDIIKTFISETFINSDNFIYISLGNEKYYVIDSNNNLYYVWNNFYNVKITGGYVSMQYQNVRCLKDVFDYSKIVELFKQF